MSIDTDPGIESLAAKKLAELRRKRMPAFFRSEIHLGLVDRVRVLWHGTLSYYGEIIPDPGDFEVKASVTIPPIIRAKHGGGYSESGGDIAGVEPFLASDMGLADEEMRLEDAPVGLFMSEGELCLKTEYTRPDGAVDAYIVSSGEAFWGPAPQTVEHQRACLVMPVNWEQEIADGLAAEAKLSKYLSDWGPGPAVYISRLEAAEARIRMLEQTLPAELAFQAACWLYLSFEGTTAQGMTASRCLFEYANALGHPDAKEQLEKFLTPALKEEHE